MLFKEENVFYFAKLRFIFVPPSQKYHESTTFSGKILNAKPLTTWTGFSRTEKISSRENTRKLNFFKYY